jgi:hypothetical protein
MSRGLHNTSLIGPIFSGLIEQVVHCQLCIGQLVLHDTVVGACRIEGYGEDICRKIFD